MFKEQYADLQIGILMGEGFKLVDFLDLGWAGCIDSRKSTFGYYFNLGSAVVSWSCQKQPNVALSSIEAGYKAFVVAI